MHNKYACVQIPPYRPLVSQQERRRQLVQRLAAITERNQQTSPLLRLPAELRNKIYNYVFHSPPIRPYRDHRVYGAWAYSRRQLSLLQVCRQVYFEARLVPFKCNVFVGYAEHVIELLVTSFAPQQADVISTVDIYVDAFAVYRDGVIPDVGLKKWFTSELAEMAMLKGLKEVTLVWFGSDVMVVREGLKWEVSGVFEEVGRADIKVVVD
ncbi:tetratricopeptide-like helical [Pyrenophora seminiperda CCB06]|uniref:Tetratricopeptide-like helical n=1 Tax=Pyrenophora seminiperda CCB06 TaxID=1302712 RepID=A0A3M7LWK5_9PLEO|nr:tetratricopeptide-like helical [Pyrenophora seminiperda CCB06]